MHVSTSPFLMCNIQNIDRFVFFWWIEPPDRTCARWNAHHSFVSIKKAVSTISLSIRLFISHVHLTNENHLRYSTRGVILNGKRSQNSQERMFKGCASQPIRQWKTLIHLRVFSAHHWIQFRSLSRSLTRSITHSCTLRNQEQHS